MKADGSSGQCRTVILQILRYWIKCPDAKDGCDGIHRWWLPDDALNQGKDNVESALNFLVSKGWVRKRKTKSAKEIYSLNKYRLNEIEKFMQATGTQD